MEKFYLLTGGEFNKIRNIKIEDIEFERFCKDECVNSITIKRDICKLYYKRKKFLNFILSLIRN
ncbi:hypothetical protein H9660_12725 [Clostridium sp. Sa3CUN1]|uniref:Uncharacterized protein n=1 Tax=Clostridium gallinarum TaxID=2762246 RepID=A0ABR8Q6E6_9CLOT|nr:hypothetical protein [Clostridium gallinarum]MBD7916011.1 hypothetical protein [Clostridium gallinarum]